MRPLALVAIVTLFVALWLLTLLSVSHDALDTEQVRTVTPSTTEASTTTTEAPTTTTAPVARTAPTHLRIASTAYSETGTMADGQLAHDGAVSSHVLKRGSRWRVLTGAMAGRVFTVEDTGPLATFDISMPGRYADAVAYGRQYIDIEAVA